MTLNNDIKGIFLSRIPIVVIESSEEERAIALLKTISLQVRRPVFSWSITSGLERLDMETKPQTFNQKPTLMLAHIKGVLQPGIYILRDFHPFLTDPVHVRLIKDMALTAEANRHTLVFISHQFEIPPEIKNFSAKMQLPLPTKTELQDLLVKVAKEWMKQNYKEIAVDAKTESILLDNLSGLTLEDAERLARGAIFDDGALSESDVPRLAKAKNELLNRQGVLSFEYETAKFSGIGGFGRLKSWLGQRSEAFQKNSAAEQIGKPKGVLLLGVQGCGKSTAAKAVAGVWGAPLLRLDFGTLYNSYYGETEKNLRDSLKTAEAMAPCVLWIDEIEKGISTDKNDEGGPSRRILGTLLTWMADKKSSVFVVATANDVTSLPPELIRKGRFDEIFFIDLPKEDVRADIFSIHIQSRKLTPADFDIPALAKAAEGFSGAEIEQAIISAWYTAQSKAEILKTAHVLQEILQTHPLSVTMAERIAEQREWAASRTVPCD